MLNHNLLQAKLKLPYIVPVQWKYKFSGYDEYAMTITKEKQLKNYPCQIPVTNGSTIIVRFSKTDSVDLAILVREHFVVMSGGLHIEMAMLNTC